MLKATSMEREQAKIRYTLQAVPPKARKDAGEEGPYAAHVEIRTASLKSIAAQMVREGSKYSEAEILAITTQLMETVAYRLANGESVNLGSTVRDRDGRDRGNRRCSFRRGRDDGDDAVQPSSPQ